MQGICLLFLAFAGASASPRLDIVKHGFYNRANLLNARSDTPTDAPTTNNEEQPPTTTTSVQVETVYPDLPEPTCDGEDGTGCSTSTSSYTQEEPQTRVPGDCSGTSTYVGSAPSTVFSTVTQTYTVSSGNSIEMADDATLITPPPPCSTTIVHPPPFTMPLPIPMIGSTSTVLVTKKTAVPYSEPTDPPSFTDLPDSNTADHQDEDEDNDEDGDCDDGDNGVMCNVLPPEESSDSSDGGCPASDSDCDSSSDEASSSSGDTPSESATGSSSLDHNPDQASDSDDGETDGNNDDGNSNNNNDNNNGDDGYKGSSISQMTVSGVPILISPSTIQIGDHLITDFPNSPTPTTLVANDQTFTINESEVIGPQTTIPIPMANSDPDSASNSNSDSSSNNEDPTLSPITAAGLTFSIGPSEAIISGTTYTIGPDSTPTTTVIDGKTISLGPDGVGFPSTTIEAPTAPPTTTETNAAAAAAVIPSSSGFSFLSSIVAVLPFFGAWGVF